MKRMILILLATALLLTACGKKAQPPAEATAPEPVPQEAESRDIAVEMRTEHPVYSDSVESISYVIENHSEETVEFGAEYAMEHLADGAWVPLEPKGEVSWIAVLYSLEPGGAMALDAGFSFYEQPPAAGAYRLVKQVSGQKVYAEFEIGESPYTEAAPYGFAPLEELPETFGAADAAGNEVVFTGEGTRNLEAVEAFLEKTGLGVDCQLRTVQDYGEGTPMVIDVIYENDHFLWRMWSQGNIVEQRFSCIVTDGRDLFLSNGVDWANTERYGSDTAFLIPRDVTGAMLTAVEAQAAGRLEANTARYRVWSGDGTCSAALTEIPGEFSVNWQKKGEGSRGQMFTLETAVTALDWQPDGTLRLTCATAGDDGYRVFDPVSWSLMDKNS